MKLHRLLAVVVIAGLAVIGFAASAAPLTGAVSVVGTLCLGADQEDGVCTTQDVATLTYLDFIDGGTMPLNPSPGAPGTVMFLTAFGDLTPLVGQMDGAINDFALPGPGDPLSDFTAVEPLWTATGSDGTYTYALTSLTSVDRSDPDALSVEGTGSLCRNGTDCNLFSFIFTTQNAASSIRTTFSASQSAFGVKVPEPASLTLLGLGLAGFVFGARRRRR